MSRTHRPATSATTRHPLLDRVLASDGSLPFALLRRHGVAEVEVLVGEVADADLLGDIPLDGAPVLAVVPFRQARERGFTVHDDGAPLRCLVVRESERVPLPDAVAALPPESVAAEPLGFDIPDDEYAGIVRRVIDDEIGQGAGANFVVMRRFEARTGAAPVPALTSWFRALITHEVGSYWTFAVHAPAPATGGARPMPADPAGGTLSLAGATPERHLTVRDGVARMNPISGTYRHPVTGPTRDGVLEFLRDTKENEELFMVVDEEMKMMSALCPGGGRIVGPYLKQMARLSHTEYLLEGRTTLDPREALRLTMFAPTVTGSPMENACTVIARHETRPRGYYSGFLALFEPGDVGSDPDRRADDAGHGPGERPEAGPRAYSLDAPILIRTAYLHDDGRVSVPAGATLVRHSVPEHEVEETRAKAAGVLASLGLVPRGAGPDAVIDLNAQPGVAEALIARNRQLAGFWVQPQEAAPTTTTTATTTATTADPDAPEPSWPTGRSVLVVDHEDQFTTMLAHQLRHLGMNARVIRWDAVDDVLADDLVVLGPGPGDPRDREDPRIAAIARRIHERVTAGRPLLAVCLSHQVLAGLAGFPIRALPAPRQGVRLEADVFGTTAAVGYYNTFGARLTTLDAADADNPVARLALEPSADANGVLTALRGPGVASVQGHLESVLSADGITVLDALTRHVLGAPANPAATR
ncbi:chorismate-binding protein [Myceligenerans pegani]|uniref:anthranilate synthase n=1 Tax=Myceligenerans pegani TaxID=2776917 RepID=A0ABR9N146_9MICO|nr:chorismate-binding protein [Myceligenerans sp. TRM 65318]MBE1877381.1 chorismate-binding protein [Myceligenerans sp. TRM 65318]MBE3019652.1 chorismate-binding protein [Myceligenerans sp. TRM 65318]